MNVSWMTNVQYLAQVGHFFAALSVVLTVTLFGRHSIHALEVTCAVGWALAALKEFWFDLKYEKDSLKNSAMDFGFYVGGSFVGVLFFFLSR